MQTSLCNRIATSVAAFYVFLSLSHFCCAQNAVNPVQNLRSQILTIDGKADAGKTLFESSRAQCSICHNVTGMEKCGPNLEGVGEKYQADQLLTHLLSPSEFIAPGFEQVRVLMLDGTVHIGRLERANKSIHRLLTSQGKQIDLQSQEIDQVKLSGLSLMPDNLQNTLSNRDLADLLAYLQSLRFGKHQGYVGEGKPIPIQRLATPIQFRAIHSEDMAFENSVWCGALPGTKSDLLVVEHQTARIWRLIRQGSITVRKELFADLSKEVYYSGNQGLMCIAFHPKFETNRLYYLEYEIEEDAQVKTAVWERRASADGLSDSGQASRRLLDVVQPAYNHNGGCIAFGPDGMLYIGFGDGGPQRDPPGHSQNPRIFLGSMLRIDVDRRDGNLPYGIPQDNPFWDSHRKDPAIRPETWAIGFREPWRYSFDSKTGDFYVGDVGQDKYEEVCIVQRGENHGWNVREAFFPFSDEYRRDKELYTDPVFAYEHGLGFSVTGGYVYRGKSNASFDGVYIFGDYNTRRVWGLKQSNRQVEQVVEIGLAPRNIASFGVDQHGEIYIVSYMGVIYHLDLSGVRYPGN